MNVARLLELLTMFEKAFCVGPGSVKDHPPTEIKVCSPGFLLFKAVKRLYREPPFASIGVIWKLLASKNANAKLIEVKPSRLRSSGATLRHARVFAQDS